MDNKASESDFLPRADWSILRLRAVLLHKVRDFFASHGFLEVETPLLSADTVVDRHLNPMAVDLPSGNGRPRRYWLQTSPEFGMKRLLAAGAEAIYQITRAFRHGEQGALHNPEFTMVEWYRVGDGMDEGMTRLSDLAETLLQRGPADRFSYGEAFERYVGVDPHTATIEQLMAAARRHRIDIPASLAADDRDAWLDVLLVELVQPHLGRTQPALLYDYPAGQAALARVSDDESPVAERFELYVDGVELANGYHELTDPAELRRRNTRTNAQRQQDGKPPLPVTSRLLEAMDAGLPASTGVALGFDRVVMVAAGAERLSDVMPFPIDRA